MLYEYCCSVSKFPLKFSGRPEKPTLMSGFGRNRAVSFSASAVSISYRAAISWKFCFRKIDTASEIVTDREPEEVGVCDRVAGCLSVFRVVKSLFWATAQAERQTITTS